MQRQFKKSPISAAGAERAPDISSNRRGRQLLGVPRKSCRGRVAKDIHHKIVRHEIGLFQAPSHAGTRSSKMWGSNLQLLAGCVGNGGCGPSRLLTMLQFS